MHNCKNIAAFSGDTTDIIFTGDPAHAIAAADRIAGRSGNTTHITASGTFNGGIGFTGDNCSVFRLADDTSHVIFLPVISPKLRLSLTTALMVCSTSKLSVPVKVMSSSGSKSYSVATCPTIPPTLVSASTVPRFTHSVTLPFGSWRCHIMLLRFSQVLPHQPQHQDLRGSLPPCWRIHPKYPPQKSPRIGRDHRGSR